MSTLTIQITTTTETDYDGINETTKRISGDIDGIALIEIKSCPETDTDTTCKTEYKTMLTDLGYTWDTEA